MHVTASNFFRRILRSEALVYKHIFFRTAVLRKLFDIRFSYKHCNFSHICLLVKMALKTVTRSILKGTNALRLKRKREEMVMMARRLVETVTSITRPQLFKSWIALSTMPDNSLCNR